MTRTLGRLLIIVFAIIGVTACANALWFTSQGSSRENGSRAHNPRPNRIAISTDVESRSAGHVQRGFRCDGGFYGQHRLQR